MGKIFTFSLCALTFTVTALGATAASAAELDYRYAESRYQRVDLDNGVDGDGFGIGGWFRVNQRFFVAADVGKIDLSNGADVTSTGAGVGIIAPLSDNWDGIGVAMLRRASIDSPGGDRTENGYAVQLGVRGQPARKIETRALLVFADVGGSDTSVTLTGDYYFTPQFSAGAALNFAGDSQALSLGARYYFGRKD